MDLASPTSWAAHEFRKGDILAGKYEFEQVIGTGAMGVVIAARHLALDERVAIKFLQPEVLQNSEAVARFTREAQSAVRIKSEHVARVTDVGNFDDGAPFMVMEYLEGVDLSSWLKAQGRFAAFQAVEFVLQACEAFAEAHVLGIVHRDIKPANLFCVRRRDGALAIKVLDFGISKVSDARHSSAFGMTGTATLMGSPGYMSPEQLQSPRDVDHRTDIWSLGVLLFELLTGTSPFGGETLPELILNITTKPPTSLLELRPELPEALAAVISVCLRKDRAERYSNVGELVLALQPFAPKRAEVYVERVLGIIESAGLSISTPHYAPQDQDAATVTEQTKVTWGQTSPPMQRPRRWFMLAALVLVAALGIGVLALKRIDPGAPGAPDKPVAVAAAKPARTLEKTAPLPQTNARAQETQVQPPALVAAQSLGATDATDAMSNPSPHNVVSAGKTKSSKGQRRAAPIAARKPSESTRNSVDNSVAGSTGATASACDPPYELDALGRKHFKRECFLNQTQ
jgi:serine/threonine-protein kinase